MLFRRLGTAALLTAAVSAAAVALATSSHAAYAPTTALQVRNLAADSDSSIAVGTSIGACNFLFSGPSTNPNYTPFRIEGQATAASTRPVASVELSCQLRTATHSVLGTLTQNTPGAASAVAGSVNVYTFGPYLICTMVNVHYMDGGESNNAEIYYCQPLQGVLG